MIRRAGEMVRALLWAYAAQGALRLPLLPLRTRLRMARALVGRAFAHQCSARFARTGGAW